jgi:hypothetical protein
MFALRTRFVRRPFEILSSGGGFPEDKSGAALPSTPPQAHRTQRSPASSTLSLTLPRESLWRVTWRRCRYAPPARSGPSTPRGRSSSTSRGGPLDTSIRPTPKPSTASSPRSSSRPDDATRGCSASCPHRRSCGRPAAASSRRERRSSPQPIPYPLTDASFVLSSDPC